MEKHEKNIAPVETDDSYNRADHSIVWMSDIFPIRMVSIISIRFRRPSQIRALRRRQSTLIFQIMSGMILQRSLPRRFIIRNQIIEIEVC